MAEDRIDLDAAGGRRFIGAAPFSGTAGDVHAVRADGLTLVEVDRDGDPVADPQAELAGAPRLTAANFTDLSSAALVKSASQLNTAQAAAVSLDPFMSVAADATIANATVDPHATVRATARANGIDSPSLRPVGSAWTSTGRASIRKSAGTMRRAPSWPATTTPPRSMPEALPTYASRRARWTPRSAST